MGFPNLSVLVTRLVSVNVSCSRCSDISDSVSTARYVIPNSFHPLLRRIHRVIRKTRLGEFWLGVWKRYHRRAVVLDQSQIEWIIKAKIDGEKTNEDIARIQEVSVRRVQQLYAEYRETQ